MILKNVCSYINRDYPVKFWQDYDLRTMKLMAGNPRLDWPNGLVKHYALHDVIAEAAFAREYWKIVRT